jgi:hypothetical protein
MGYAGVLGLVSGDCRQAVRSVAHKGQTGAAWDMTNHAHGNIRILPLARVPIVLRPIKNQRRGASG